MRAVGWIPARLLLSFPQSPSVIPAVSLCHSRSLPLSFPQTPFVIPASFQRESIFSGNPERKTFFYFSQQVMPSMTGKGRFRRLDFAEELLKQGAIRANAGDVLDGFPSSGVAVSEGFVVFLVGQERENRFEVIP